MQKEKASHLSAKEVKVYMVFLTFSKKTRLVCCIQWLQIAYFRKKMLVC